MHMLRNSVSPIGYARFRFLVSSLIKLIRPYSNLLFVSVLAFEEGRGYPIEREIYISSLKSTPRKKIDTSNISLEPDAPTSKSVNKMRSLKNRQHRKMIGQLNFASPRRGFAKDGPFSPPHFGFGGPPPSFRPMPPPPGMPPVPPPPIPGPPPMYGPRPFRYGPPPRSAMPPLPPRPGFPIPGFLLPCSPRVPGGARLPHVPPTRLPPPKMPLPPPPPPPLSQSVPRAVALKRLRPQKIKSHARNGVVASVRNSADLIRHNSQTSRTLPKLMKEQDFTVDTFEENLLAPNQPKRRLTKARFNQYK
ncbi:formin-A-like [Ceratina calcarata]|uniref:Formin-A-like n=1 Tax=Ceratina calcarata TaxID=156304 RepID=A0AAJ7W9X5_9HYME|nr:formin-A-like [Ceratina calcarata]